MKSLEMALNLSRQNLTRIVIEGKVLKCYRGDELFQEHSFEKISNLDCSYNQLTSLPDTLPRGLKELYCIKNPLKYVPFLPERPKYLFVPEEFEEKHSSERYPEYYQKQQRNRYLIRLFFSEMGFSDDFLKTELEKE